MSRKTITNLNPAKGSRTFNDETEPSVLGSIKIDNVNKSLWLYIRKHKRWELLFFLIVTLVWEALTAFIIIRIATASGGDNSGSAASLAILLAPPIVLIGFWYYRLKKQFEAAFLQEFADVNGYSFDKDGSIDETYGTLFRLNGRQSVSDVVSGNYDGNTLRIFLYELVISSGRSEERFHYTVTELDLHGQLPNLLMVSKHHTLDPLSLSSTFSIKNTISLEGDFNQYFTLYGAKGNEIEALEVFSPDTMALMEDESAYYTVEFAGNRIYIYSSGYVVTTSQLSQIFNLAKKLINKIAPLASRLQHDSAIIPAHVNLRQTRRHSWLTGNPGNIVSYTVAGAGLLAAIVMSFAIKPATPSLTQSSATSNTSSGSAISLNPEFDAATNKASNLDAQGVSTGQNTGTQIVAAGQQALQAAKSDQQKELAYYWIGDGYFWEGNDALTVSSEQQALQYYANDPYAYIMKAQGLLNLGRATETITATDQAIKLDPNISSSYRIKAFALKNLGQKQTALDTIDTAVGIDTKASNQQFLTYDQNDKALVISSTSAITIKY